MLSLYIIFLIATLLGLAMGAVVDLLYGRQSSLDTENSSEM